MHHSWFLDGEIVSTFDTPSQVKLGSCDLIEEVMIGEDRLLRFSGVPRGTFWLLIMRSMLFCFDCLLTKKIGWRKSNMKDVNYA